MIFKNPKFIKFVDGKKYFDVDVIEGEHCFPYTYLESDNPENATTGYGGANGCDTSIFKITGEQAGQEIGSDKRNGAASIEFIG